MNEHKIEIIVASNDRMYWAECLRYIRNLNIPEGYKLSHTCMTDAVSMTSAYNEAMERSDAKYKIYIHQDTFLIYADLLYDLLGFFAENPQVGMVGVLGRSEARQDGNLWNAWDCGRARAWDTNREIDIDVQSDDMDKKYVKAIDGMFMATQYDVKWRDDVISGWDFYDISQCCEFLKQGYQVAVPYQKEPWCLHDCGHSKLGQYDAAKRTFCEIYSEFGYHYQESEPQDGMEQRYSLLESIIQLVSKLIEQNEFTAAEMMIAKASELRVKSTELSVFGQILEIRKREQEISGNSLFFEGCHRCEELLEKYTEIKFGLRRLEYGIDQKDSLFDRWCTEEKLSKECIEYMIGHCVAEQGKVKRNWRRKDDEPLVSVIIPTYNSKHMLKRCIDSVLGQTYQNYEIIMVDDCSTDGTMEFVEAEYGTVSQINIVYVRNDQQIGAAASQNVGVSYANGEYIAFLSSEDEWFSDKLERQISRFLECDTSAGAVYCRYCLHADRSAGWPPTDMLLDWKSGYIFYHMLLTSLVGMSTLVMRKTVFLELGGLNEQLQALENYELVLRIAREYQIVLVDEILASVKEAGGHGRETQDKDKIVTQCFIMDSFCDALGLAGTKQDKFKMVCLEAGIYGCEEFFIECVMRAFQDEDYLAYAKEKWDERHPSSHPEQVDTITIEGVKACTGCMACFNECPVNAIHMECDQEGFAVPVVVKEQCIGCGKCKLVCPVCNETPGVLCPEECYAVMGSDEIRKLCSSGGVFGVLSRKMLEEGGYVSGVVWNENWQAEHIVSNDEEDIGRMYSSKYVQSDIKDTYRQIKDLLEDGQKVLFSGCGCQAAGLKRYLQREYDNLLIVDIVCHGVPSPGVWDTWLEHDVLEASGRGREEIAEISFRKKAVLGWNSGVYIRYQDGGETVQHGRHSAYMTGFLINWTLRECCYACQFKNKKYSDITLGDFWGINQIHQLDDGLGTSFVTVNTTKGAVYFKRVWDRFIKIEGLQTAQAVSYNPCISRSIDEPVSRALFFKEWGKDIGVAQGVTLDRYMQRAKDRMHFDMAIVCMWSLNYGNAMTNYALYTFLKAHKKRIVMLDNYCSLIPKDQFLDFAKEHYVLSSEYFPNRDYKMLNECCDTFVVASDQTWNYGYAVRYGYFDYFLLDFVEEQKKKVSYAASFGNIEVAPPDEIGQKLYPRFQAISVREEFGVELCQNRFGVDATWVMDPVFLLNKSEYDELLRKTPVLEEGPYIAVYLLDPTAEKRQLCVRIQEELGGIKIINMADANLRKQELYFRVLQYDNIRTGLRVEEWLSYIRNAAYVITDSFHGTCFALIFEKRFAAVKHRESSRFNTFTSIPEIADRILDKGADYNTRELIRDIDYETVNARLDTEIEKSKRFIRERILL